MIDSINFYNFFRELFHSSDGDFSISLMRFFLGLVTIFVFYDINSEPKYFSSRGYFPSDFRRNLGFLPSLFDLKFSSVEPRSIIFYIGIGSSICFTLGFLTQISCLLCFICLASFVNRNPYCFHSGTALLKLVLFLMIFSKAGQQLSIDKYLNIQNYLPSFNFFEKLIKIQIGVMYLKTFWYKLLNLSWRDGSAIYYTSKNLIYSNVKRFNLFKSLFSNKWFCIFSCFIILSIELIVGISCFFSNLWVLAFGLGWLLHILFIFFLRIRDFPYICLSALLIFIPSNLIESYLNLILK